MLIIVMDHSHGFALALLMESHAVRSIAHHCLAVTRY